MVEDLTLREPLFVHPSLGLMEMLNIFHEGHCHLAVVSADPASSLEHLRKGRRPGGMSAMLGIVTLEDVLEKIIQSDIVDETDTINYPSVYPNGGAPTVFYHHVIRPSACGKSDRVTPLAPALSSAASVTLEQLQPSVSFIKKKNYRNLLASSGSVVKTEQYSAMRKEYATFAPRESIVHVMRDLDDESIADYDDKKVDKVEEEKNDLSGVLSETTRLLSSS